MKWFKHMTDSRSGRVLSESMKLFRHSGYAFWFILHEVYGYYYNDVDKDGFFHTSVDFLCKETRIQKKKLYNILNILHKKMYCRIISGVRKYRSKYLYSLSLRGHGEYGSAIRM